MITISAIEPFSSFSHTTNIQSFQAILSIASQRKSTHMESPLDRLRDTRSISFLFWILLTKRRVQEIKKRQGDTSTFDRKLGIPMLVEHAKGLIMLCIILSLFTCKSYMNSLPFLQLTMIFFFSTASII